MANTAARLAAIRHVALDLDGTLYSGHTLFDWTPGFLGALAELGIGRTFLTNNSSRSRAEYQRHLAEFGLRVEREEIHTSGLATIDHLRHARPAVRRLFVLGTPSLASEFREAGYEVVDDDPEVVVVGFDTTLSYAHLCRAAWWIRQDRPWLATHPDRFCPTDRPTWLVDCGALAACLEVATGRAPEAVPGKPHPGMLAGVLERHGLQPHELAMVGDRLSTDVALAEATGAFGVLVLSGEATASAAAAADPPPDLVVGHVGELGERLRAAHRPGG